MNPSPADVIMAMRNWSIPEMRQFYTALAVSAGLEASGQGATTQEWQMLAPSLQAMVQAIIETSQQTEADIIEAVGDDSILKFMPPSQFAREAAEIIEKELR